MSRCITGNRCVASSIPVATKSSLDKKHLVQQIDPVNVAAVHSVQFVVRSISNRKLNTLIVHLFQPNPAAGPDSSQ